MLCPECVAGGSRSHVRTDPGAATSPGGLTDSFWDEDDVYHVHDPAEYVSLYYCSNGHEWRDAQHKPCPADGCDWPADRAT